MQNALKLGPRGSEGLSSFRFQISHKIHHLEKILALCGDMAYWTIFLVMALPSCI